VYAYAYVTFGEVVAWMVGGILILELTFGSACVAAGWSEYVQSILRAADMSIPIKFSKTPAHGGMINVPAIVVSTFVCAILYLGTKDSKKLNNILVFIKMASVFAFIVAAVPHFDATNWDNFMPYGMDGVMFGSSILFFAFSGFGQIASAAEECQNPKRDLTIGIIGSLVMATVIYVVMAGLVTGIAPYTELDNGSAMAHALQLNGSNIGSAIVGTGAVCGMTTVLMMNIYAQSRIFYVMGRDGLLPSVFTKLHPTYGSPSFAIILFSCIAAVTAAFFPLELLSQLCSIGGLMDYVVVVSAVMVLRKRYPDAKREFKCPAVFVIAPVALAVCIYMLFTQIVGKDWAITEVGSALFIWLGFVFVLYLVRRMYVGGAIAKEA
jgi:APA family basic amino acid/polyamine antiporter